MINYLCKKCNLECETSVCPVCNQRTEIIKTEIFYCIHCSAPSFEKKCHCCNSECISIGTDLRPVFPEERLLIEVLLNEPFKFADKAVWNTGGSKYIINGKREILSFKELIKNNNPVSVKEKIDQLT